MNFHGCQEGYRFIITWKNVEEHWVKSWNDPHYNLLSYLQITFNSYNSDLLIDANAALIREFGSLNHSVTNVIYTNGAIDPWLHTGILVSQEPSTIAMVIDSE